MSAGDARGVTAFLDSYREAFGRKDARAIAELYAYPGHVTSDAGEIVLLPITTKEDWVGKIERLLGMYRAVGVHSAEVVGLEVTKLSPRLLQAFVRWALSDDRALPLYAFEATYTLVEIDDTLRIAAVAHNEVPRYRECLARLQSQREGSAPSAR